MATTTGAPRRSSGTIEVLPMPFGIGLGVGGVCVTLSAAVGLVGDGDEFSDARVAELILGITSMLLGFASSRAQKHPPITRAAAMSMFVVSWMAMNIVAVIAFWLSGELASPLDAVFEAVSASTTTGFTTVAEPETLSYSLRFLRVIMPWATGLGVLLVSMGILPAAIAGAELLPERQLRGRRKLVPSVSEAVRNILGLYLLLTISLAVGYWIAGMGLFDGITYALSTASTGGMANHADSLGHFDSTLIEWIASAGMVAAGGNLIVVWWAIRGRIDSVWKSTELRLYLALIAIGFSVVYFAGVDTSASDAAVAISSALSTTGFRSSNWAAGPTIVQATLLVAGGIGAMSGSVGSGFRQARAARIALEVRRSLQQLLSPHRENIIRVDGVAVKENSLSLTYGYLWMHAFTLAAVAVLLGSREFDLVATLSFALNSVSNVGYFVDGTEVKSFVDPSGWTELVAAFGMLLGRLSIYPALLTITGLGRWISRFKPHRSIGAT